MALSDIELSLFAFPQRWNAGRIDFRLLLIPTGDPTVASGSGLPAFAGNAWSVDAIVQPGLDSLLGPSLPTSPAPQTKTFVQPAPANALALWQALATRFTPVPADPAPARLLRLGTTSISKELPPSYRAAAAFSRSSDNTTTGNEFGCALRENDYAKANDPKPTSSVTWGAIISFALRQPLLARALGLIYDFNLTVNPTDSLGSGGWLYLQLSAASSAGVNPAVLRSYAARLPALDPAPKKGRALFAPVLFPVGVADPGNYDKPLAESALFDDGFAKIVHAAQAVDADAASSGHSVLPPVTDAGLDLGWDDEQVTAWLNRQVDGLRARLDPTVTAVEAPLGISGYRIDVRQPDVPAFSKWQSLCRAFSANPKGKSAALVFPPAPAAPVFSQAFDSELTVEPTPVRSIHATDLGAWLPKYFARWQGGSLVVNDTTLFQLSNVAAQSASTDPTQLPPMPAPTTAPASVYAAHLPTLKLRYGKLYELRCRFSDLTGGGPTLQDTASNPSPSPTANLRFLRHLPPKALQLSTDIASVRAGQPTPVVATIKEIDLWRPLIAYPELKFVGFDDPSIVKQLIKNAPAAYKSGTTVGVYDPDVTEVLVTVQVRLAAHDTGPSADPTTVEDGFYTLYQTALPLPAYNFKDPFSPGPPLAIALDYVEVPDLSVFVAPAAGVSTLPVPAARDIRIRCQPACADKPNYFGSAAAQLGIVSSLSTRSPSQTEAALFAPQEESVGLNAILLQPIGDFAGQLASQLDLEVNELEFSAHGGERVVFGASAKLRYTLSGDKSSIKFASNGELLGHWIAVSQLVLARDWTWDGLAPSGIEVSRRDAAADAWEVLGSLQIPFTIPPRAETSAMQRGQTRLIFFDAVDPNPSASAGSFPELLTPSWQFRPILRDLPASVGDAQLQQHSVRLPVAVAPAQTPQLVSVGVALSPFVHDENYASTGVRERALWFEFAEPVLDPNDQLFGRILSYGPDPLLSGRITHFLAPESDAQIDNGNLSVFDSVRNFLPNPPPANPLAIDPELIRVIVPDQAEDSSGLGAMMEMIAAHPAANGSPSRHFLVPLPPGVNVDDPKLFGFWTYEFRIGHKTIWSTAQARFGRPLIVNGVQHPPPGLRCTPSRIKEPPVFVIAGNPPKSRITVAATFATAMYEDKVLVDPEQGDPRTQIWVLLYAQVTQADGLSRRNILLGRSPAIPQFRLINGVKIRPSGRDCWGVATFDEATVQQKLADLALPADSALSVVAVEVLPGGNLTEGALAAQQLSLSLMEDKPLAQGSTLGGNNIPNNDPNAIVSDPLGDDLGSAASRRILRCSPLTPVPDAC